MMKVALMCVCIAATLMPTLQARHPELTLRMLSRAPCQDRNIRLASFIEAAKEESGLTLLPHIAKNFDDFVLEVKAALDSHTLDMRPIDYIFSDISPINPTCNGIWAEFGVAWGGTVNLAAKFREKKCSPACPAVHGFDTFTGLPEDWVATTTHTFETKAFDQSGSKGGFPDVEPNVNLVKGLFNESIPLFLKDMNIFAGSANAISYLHVDCDLYTGTKDILHLLGDKIVVGTIIVFDELVNYEFYRNHEIKALWEWLQATGVKLYPLGILGPLPNETFSVRLDWSKEEVRDSHHHQQSAAFVVVETNSHGVH